MPGSSFIPLLSTFFSFASITASCSRFVFVNTEWSLENLTEISCKLAYLLSTIAFRLCSWVLIATYLESFSLIIVAAILACNLGILMSLQSKLDVEPLLHSFYSLFFPVVHFSLFGKALEKRQAWRLTAALSLAGNIVLALALLVLPVIGRAYFLELLSLQVHTGQRTLPFVLFIGALSVLSLALTYHSTFGRLRMISEDLAKLAVPAVVSLVIVGTLVSNGTTMYVMKSEEVILPLNNSCYNPGLCKSRPIHVSTYENIEDCITQCQNFEGCKYYGILTDTKQCVLAGDCARVTMTYKKDRSLHGSCGKLALTLLSKHAHHIYLLVHGVWSAWGEWSSCDKACGRGIHRRSRTCTNPSPMGGGKQCAGKSLETEHCKNRDCGEYFFLQEC